MAEFEMGDVRANGLQFHYLEMGEGPLALYLHGFPYSPWTYRYLLPELAEAGYRAVVPFNLCGLFGVFLASLLLCRVTSRNG